MALTLQAKTIQSILLTPWDDPYSLYYEDDEDDDSTAVDHHSDLVCCFFFQRRRGLLLVCFCLKGKITTTNTYQITANTDGQGAIYGRG